MTPEEELKQLRDKANAQYWQFCRCAKMRIRNKGKSANGTRDHSRPRPNGKKIRVKH